MLRSRGLGRLMNPRRIPLTLGTACPKRNRRSRNAKALRHVVVGSIASAGAFLPFGITPLAHADELDVIIEPLINSLASVDPTLGADMTGWLANLDSALAGAAAVDTIECGASSLGSLSDLSDASAAATTANPFSTFVQGLEQEWINSPLGQQVDSSAECVV